MYLYLKYYINFNMYFFYSYIFNIFISCSYYNISPKLIQSECGTRKYHNWLFSTDVLSTQWIAKPKEFLSYNTHYKLAAITERDGCKKVEIFASEYMSFPETRGKGLQEIPDRKSVV